MTDDRQQAALARITAAETRHRHYDRALLATCSLLTTTSILRHYAVAGDPGLLVVMLIGTAWSLVYVVGHFLLHYLWAVPTIDRILQENRYSTEEKPPWRK